MPGTVDQMRAKHARAGGRLHGLEHAGTLVGPPILLARDETGRHVDGPARPGFEFGGEGAGSAAAIALQAALESGALIFAGVDRELVIGKPSVCRNLARGR